MPLRSPLKLEDCRCPLCGSGRSSPSLRGRDNLCGIPGEFQLSRCQDCRHVYLNPRPTAESLAACYPPGYGPHQDAGSTPQSGKQTDSATPSPPSGLIQRLKHIPGLRAFYYWLTEKRSEILPAPPHPGATALELGCATGRFLERLRNAGWQAEGVELMPEAAARARERGFNIHEGTLESFPFPDESFDAVFAWMVVEHLPDPIGTLRELHRILRPDGRLYVSVPNFGCWERHVFRSSWWALELPRHLQHFTAATVRRMLRDTGFEQQQIVHQRNALNIISSLGIVLQRIGLNSWGRRCIAFTDNPTMGWQLVLAPAAIVLAGIRQSGRLTIATRKLPPVSATHRAPSRSATSSLLADPPNSGSP